MIWEEADHDTNRDGGQADFHENIFDDPFSNSGGGNSRFGQPSSTPPQGSESSQTPNKSFGYVTMRLCDSVY